MTVHRLAIWSTSSITVRKTVCACKLRGIERIDHKNGALLPGPMPKDLAEIVGDSQLGAERGSRL
jgi:hypothetical protein